MTDEIIPGTHFSPRFHLRVGETEFEVKTLMDIIYQYKIDKFVEIGIHEGGLTEYLIHDTNVIYLGIEINSGIPDARIRERVCTHGQKILYLDCFSDECYQAVKEFVHTQGRTLIYCDNGNKPAEIRFYSSIPMQYDLLLTHDYSDGVRTVNGLGIVAPAREITPDDIAFLNNSTNFDTLSEELLKETRIVGWIRK